MQLALMRGHAYLQAANADQACKVLIPAIEPKIGFPANMSFQATRKAALSRSMREGGTCK